MKRLIAILLTVAVAAPLYGQAAKTSSNSPKGKAPKSSPEKPLTATCNILCCQESFPVDFCTSNGTKVTKCSTDPETDPTGTPAKAFIPGCIQIMNPMDSEGIYMPTTAPVQMPGVVLQEPGNGDLNFEMDYYEWSGAVGQWGIDQSWWSYGDPPVEPNIVWDPGPEPICCLDSPPDCDTDTCEQYRADLNAYYAYLGEEKQYEADDSAWQVNVNSYTQIWNDVEADSDATAALNDWLNNICSPPVHRDGPSCCIHVFLDNNSTHFGISGTAPGRTVDQQYNDGYPACNESTCPDLDRFIIINTSNAFRNQDLQNTVPDVSLYSFRVHPTGFYTDPQFNPKVYDGFSVGSFFNTIEHEIGHWLGLHHPEGDAGKGDYYLCHNCYTANPLYAITGDYNPDGYKTVMAQNNVEVNTPTFNLTDEDKCQFQQLYCPSNIDWADCPAGVKGVTLNNAPSPEIYPNPTTGGCQLKYEVSDRSLVQIAIYDLLGNRVRLVSSDYEESGNRTIPLGTESLPSGQYVCRVRLGNDVTYINLAIQK